MIKEKWKKDELSFTRITNNDLICADCINKLDDEKIFKYTTMCKEFHLKPKDVLKGGKCKMYKKEA